MLVKATRNGVDVTVEKWCQTWNTTLQIRIQSPHASHKSCPALPSPWAVVGSVYPGAALSPGRSESPAHMNLSRLNPARLRRRAMNMKSRDLGNAPDLERRHCHCRPHSQRPHPIPAQRRGPDRCYRKNIYAHASNLIIQNTLMKICIHTHIHDTRTHTNKFVGRGGALIDSTPCVQRVAGANSALVAT